MEQLYKNILYREKPITSFLVVNNSAINIKIAKYLKSKANKFFSSS